MQQFQPGWYAIITAKRQEFVQPGPPIAEVAMCKPEPPEASAKTPGAVVVGAFSQPPQGRLQIAVLAFQQLERTAVLRTHKLALLHQRQEEFCMSIARNGQRALLGYPLVPVLPYCLEAPVTHGPAGW